MFSALFLQVLVFFVFSGTTSALMKTFTRQQYLLYAPGKNEKTKQKQNRSEHKGRKNETKVKNRQTRELHFLLYFFGFISAFVFAFCFVLAFVLHYCYFLFFQNII